MEKGIVYLLTEWGSSPERFKIGITKGSVEDRIKQLQTGSSNEIVMILKYESYNYLKIEKFLHKKYSKYSTDGGQEWFELSSTDVSNFINECKTIDDRINFLMNCDNPFII
jgi:hypothetical protein